MTRVVSCQNCGETHCIEENVVCSNCGDHVERRKLGSKSIVPGYDRPTCEQEDCEWCLDDVDPCISDDGTAATNTRRR
jgi:hypothetical protein